MQPRPPRSTLFPYTTLFRSNRMRQRVNATPTAIPAVLEDYAEVFRRHQADLGRPLSPSNYELWRGDRKSTRLNSSHRCISYAVFCLKKKKITKTTARN